MYSANFSKLTFELTFDTNYNPRKLKHDINKFRKMNMKS